ncbi:MAG: type II/IV secretion system ATPase subunit [Candidatus Aenigmarchaeota archaeon]|nr:type II/IV secretion system ATPase subunit [Candidatus Aenigmarchaeota archaeon]
MHNIVINGKKIRLRERCPQGLGAKLSGRKLIVTHRSRPPEIDFLVKKIENLEKNLASVHARRPVRIEMKERNDMSAEYIRSLIKDELSRAKPRQITIGKIRDETPDITVKKRIRFKRMPLETLPKAAQGILMPESGILQPAAEAFQLLNAPQSPRAVDGILIPEIQTKKYEEDASFDPNSVAMKYPLIPKKPKEGERVYAYVDIHFDKTRSEMVYNLVEPHIDARKKAILEEIKDYIQEKVDVNFGHIKRDEAVNYILGIFEKAVKFLRIRIDQKSLDDIRYYVIRDFIGLEKIEPLMQDPNIEDISCDGIGIPIFVYHRNGKIGSIKTNTAFEDKESADSFVNKLAERCGKSVSVAKPLLDGTLPDGSRVQATLGSDIARHGSNFTIRMFTEEPLTPVDLIRSGMCDLKTMALVWFAVEHMSSILVSGGTATGKTSLLNAFSLFIKPQMKIVSIEDTAELRLPHSHWVPEVARTSIAVGREVDMFELLRESLRQRPDYIIVGEVRGKEAYVLFQQMATGHAGFSTIHADSFQKLVDRLITPPIELPPNLLENLDLVIFIRRIKRGNKYKRRIDSVVEMLGVDPNNRPVVNEIIKWNPSSDTFASASKSTILRKIAEKSNMTDGDINEEIKRRAAILQWLSDRNINDYRKVSSVINLYYISPEFVMKKIGI